MAQKLDTGAQLVIGLEGAWRAIRDAHPDVPEVVLIVGSGTAMRGAARYGHYANLRWRIVDGGRRLAEIFISGEGLERGAGAVMGTLLHEAAHAAAATRGVQDTSRRGQYHNKRFKELGEEFGLELEYDKRIGWSRTTLPESTRTQFADAIAELDRAIQAIRTSEVDAAGLGSKGGTGGGRGGGSRTTPLASCTCGRKIRVAPAVLEKAPITCGACGGDFGWPA